MASSSNDMEKLVDFFLSPNFPIYDAVRQGGTSYETGEDVSYEGEVEEVEDGIGDNNPNSTALDDKFLKTCGTKLRRMGDDFFHHKFISAGSLDPALKETVQKLAHNKGGDEMEAWAKFKSYIDSCIKESDAKDAYMTLGAVLMVAKGLATLGSGVPVVARRFTMRYIAETGLDDDIIRMGGLKRLYENELD